MIPYFLSSARQDLTPSAVSSSRMSRTGHCVRFQCGVAIPSFASAFKRFSCSMASSGVQRRDPDVLRIGSHQLNIALTPQPPGVVPNTSTSTKSRASESVSYWIGSFQVLSAVAKVRFPGQLKDRKPIGPFTIGTVSGLSGSLG